MQSDQIKRLCDNIQKIVEMKGTPNIKFLTQILAYLSRITFYNESSQNLYDYLIQTIDSLNDGNDAESTLSTYVRKSFMRVLHIERFDCVHWQATVDYKVIR